jgi:predicted ATP-grasp superfamily ATP-dependent carboligase
MADLYELVDRPSLADPVLVVGLDGWIDAGLAAAAATAHLLEQLDTTVVAAFDADVLVDHRSRRPVMHLVEGVNTGLTWPSIELRHGRDADGRDLLLLVGAEPDVRWRAFSTAVAALAVELGVGLATGFGAYPAPVPHTRPGRLATTATSAELAGRAGQVRTTVDVPAGALGAIERACADAGIPAVGMWAQVPHYASAMAFPAAAVTLLEGLTRLTGIRVDTSGLQDAGRALSERLDALVADNPEHVEMVRALEASVDAEASDPANLPSGDELAAELQRFLREVDRGDGG